MARIDHPECGPCQEKWQLTLKGLAGPDWCPGFENYAVTVTWNGSNGRWEYTDGNGCTSTLVCHKPPGHARVWEGTVMAKVDIDGEECICILQGQDSMDCLTGGTLTGMACSCLDESPSGNSRIVVTPA